MNNCDSSQFELVPSRAIRDCSSFMPQFRGCLWMPRIPAILSVRVCMCKRLLVCFNFGVTVKWIKVFPSAYILKRVQPPSSWAAQWAALRATQPSKRTFYSVSTRRNIVIRYMKQIKKNWMEVRFQFWFQTDFKLKPVMEQFFLDNITTHWIPKKPNSFLAEIFFSVPGSCEFIAAHI